MIHWQPIPSDFEGHFGTKFDGETLIEISLFIRDTVTGEVEMGCNAGVVAVARRKEVATASSISEKS